MKAIIQRVKKATLFSDYKKYSKIENGIIITGVFRTHMEIETILDGPNTYILEI